MRQNTVVFFGLSCCFLLGLGLVFFLPAVVSCILAWGGGGGCPHCPCLSAWLYGCSQVTSKCTPVPRLPALLRHSSKSPGRGARLGSSIQSSTICSENSPFLFLFHRPCHHRISKEEAHSEAEPEEHPASDLSTEPLLWDREQRTPGLRHWHFQKQSSGRPPSLPPSSLSVSPC